MADTNDRDPHQGDSDPLLGNKIAAAVLTAILLATGLGQLSGALYGGGGHHGGHHDELKLAYCCVELETTAGAGGGEEAKPDLGTLLAAASAKGGERGAALCKSCHSFDKGGANGTGPNLWNIVGREIASVSGYGYSSALQGLGGAWTYENLDKYIENSQNFVPGTNMNQMIRRDNKRADLLAYLGSLSDSPVAFPAPTAPAADSTE